MRHVYIVGIGQLPVQKRSEQSLRQLGAQAVKIALEDARLDRVDALYAGNMLGDELQSQKHVAALIAEETGLRNIEAIQVRAAMASGSAALRIAHLAISSGEIDTAVAVGAEVMSSGDATQALAKALDAQEELPQGLTMVAQNAVVMQHYYDCFKPPRDALAQFSVNAHDNARHNPRALFKDRQFTAEDVLSSRVISAPIRLLDCSPICDGAAAVVLAAGPLARSRHRSARILASSVATDRFRLADRTDPLVLEGARQSALAAYRQAGLGPADIDLFEAHDAFTIIACLSLEAAGFAERGQGWRLAMDGSIAVDGRVPLSTMGGLKARGHPIGATALYQACELFLQLNGEAGPNQVASARTGLMQSIGGVATTVISHILAR